MIFSLFLILTGGALVATLLPKIRIPALVGYLLFGVLMGAIGLMDERLTAISSDIRRIALVIILLRAGMSLDLSALKKNGRTAILFCFLPALFEMTAVGLLSPLLFGFSVEEGFLLGSVLAAVSPAVVVPRMLDLTEKKRGTTKGIPQTVVAGASADDIFVVLAFGVFLTAVEGGGFSLASLWELPVSIVLGIGSGLLVGWGVGYALRVLKISGVFAFLLLLGVGFGFSTVETAQTVVPFSGLLGVMALGYSANFGGKEAVSSASASAKKAWSVAEIFLFVLVGSAVSLTALWQSLGWSLLLLTVSLAVRSLGVLLSTVKNGWSKKERLFAVFSYLPKATVQAAIGGVPLSMGLACGEIVLSVSALAIVLTAPLGALLIDQTSEELLHDDAN